MTKAHHPKDEPQTSHQANEGEGNRTAARAYNAEQHKFAESGRVEEKAREAKRALDGIEGSELKQAEEEGKRHSHGEDPQLRAPTKNKH
jgi:hypothetical protein